MAKEVKLIPEKKSSEHQIAELQKAVEKEKQERTQKANAALEAWSKEYKCVLVGVPVYAQNQDGSFVTKCQIQIIAQ